jgi:ABC-type branched-subunit amino acid transport system substrate-binding protein
MKLGWQRRVVAVTAAAAALLCAVVGVTQTFAANKATKATVLNVGDIASFSGPLSTEFAVPAQDGFNLAIKEANQSHYIPGLTIDLHPVDDGSLIPNAINDFNTFAADKYPVVVHTCCVAQAEAIQPLAAKDKILYINFGAGPPAQGNYLYYSSDSIDPNGTVLNYVEHTLGATRVAIVYPSDNSGLAPDEQLWVNDLTKNSTPSVATLSVLTADTDFTSVITDLAADHVTAIGLCLTPTQAGPFLAQLAAYGGFSNVIKFGVSGWNPGDIERLSNGDTSNTYFPQAWFPGAATAASAAFVTAYSKAYGAAPSSTWPAIGYNQGWLLVNTIKELRAAGKPINGTTLYKQMPLAAKSSSYKTHGLLLNLKYNAQGIPTNSAYVLKFNSAGGLSLAPKAK